MDKEKEVELAVRKAIAQEIITHREFLQTQFKHIIWAIGIVIASGAVIFTFLFGKQIENTEKRLTQHITDKVVEYRIVENLQARMDKIADVVAEKAVYESVISKDTQDMIHRLVQKDSEKSVNELASELQKQTKELSASISMQYSNQIKPLVEEQLAKIADFNAEEIIKSASFPSGAVFAFTLTQCPPGWSPFEDGAGRVIIGVNKDKRFALKSKGGNETHTHEGKTGDRQDKGKKYGGRIHGHSNIGGAHYPDHDHELNIEGSSLPPFIALRFCIKD